MRQQILVWWVSCGSCCYWGLGSARSEGATEVAGFVGGVDACTMYVFPRKEKCRLLSIGLVGCLFLSVLDLVGRASVTWTRERTRRTDAESDDCIRIQMHSPLSQCSYLCSLPRVSNVTNVGILSQKGVSIRSVVICDRNHTKSKTKNRTVTNHLIVRLEFKYVCKSNK